MNRHLLCTTAAIGLGLTTATPTLAADPIKLTVGGFFREAYMVVLDDDDEFNDLGFNRNIDGFFNDAEIHFVGSTLLDNGLEVGARVELEGESELDGEGGGDQIDEAWIWFSGGLGEVRIGSDDEALANACIVPPGGTANFSAFSPNQWGANAGFLFAFSGLRSNSVCTGIDNRSDAQKIVYITPSFGGFQLTASYTPNPDHETHNDGVGPHIGMPPSFFASADAGVSAYLTYAYEGDDWGLVAGAGGSWEINVDGEPGETKIHGQDFYQAAINLSIGRFGIGVAGEYFHDAQDFRRTNGSQLEEIDFWVAGVGASYTMDAWDFGLQYSHREDEARFVGFSVESFDAQQDRVVATVNYALGPGINIDGEVGYSWVDTDPEVGNAFEDDYDAIEFGIGTAMSF